MTESFLKVIEQRIEHPRGQPKLARAGRLAKQDLAKRAAYYDQGRCNKVVVT
jgi:hypothetical protein